MSKFTRVSLAFAVVACLFVSGVNTLHLTPKITQLRVDLRNQIAGRAQAEAAALRAETDARALSGELLAARNDVRTVAVERQRAIADAHAVRLLVQVAEMEKVNLGIELDKAHQELARFRTAGLEPEQIVHAAEYINSLETTVTRLHSENQVLQKRMSGLIMAGDEVRLPAELKGRVMAYDPKWRFIVINVGENQGAVSRGELLVSRNGKLVAKAKISRVEPDRCIANILPDWDIGEVAEGDLAQPVPSAI